MAGMLAPTAPSPSPAYRHNGSSDQRTSSPAPRRTGIDGLLREDFLTMEAKSSAGRSRAAPLAHTPGPIACLTCPHRSNRPTIMTPCQVRNTGAHRASRQRSMVRPAPSAGQEGTLSKSPGPGHTRRRRRLPAVSPMFRLMSWPVHRNERLSSPGCRACARLSRLPATAHSRPPKVSGSRRQQYDSHFERPPGRLHRTRTPPPSDPPKPSIPARHNAVGGTHWTAVPGDAPAQCRASTDDRRRTTNYLSLSAS